MTKDALGCTRRWPTVRRPTLCAATRCASMCCLRLFRRKRVRARRHPRCESGRLPVRPRARAGEVPSARSNSVTPAAVAASGSGASSQAVAASAFPPDASPLAASRCDGLLPAVVAAAAGVPPFAGFGPVVVAPLLAEFGHISVTASVSAGKGSSSFGRPIRREAPAASTHIPMLAAGAPETARPCARICACAGACIPLAAFAGAALLARASFPRQLSRKPLQVRPLEHRFAPPRPSFPVPCRLPAVLPIPYRRETEEGIPRKRYSESPPPRPARSDGCRVIRLRRFCEPPLPSRLITAARCNGRRLWQSKPAINVFRYRKSYITVIGYSVFCHKRRSLHGR